MDATQLIHTTGRSFRAAGPDRTPGTGKCRYADFWTRLSSPDQDV